MLSGGAAPYQSGAKHSSARSKHTDGAFTHGFAELRFLVRAKRDKEGSESVTSGRSGILSDSHCCVTPTLHMFEAGDSSSALFFD